MKYSVNVKDELEVVSTILYDGEMIVTMCDYTLSKSLDSTTPGVYCPVNEGF